MSIFPVPTPQPAPRARLSLVSSKSESNRGLILRALAGPGVVELDHLSEARDTRLLDALLRSDADELDARDAGTTLRFLTAWCVAANRPARLTGTPRMCQRPIGILVDALRELGAEIDYEGVEGFPPLRVRGFTQQRREVAVRGDVSSQFISALLLIAPFLPQGLRLRLVGDIASRPYIDMTLAWMRRFGLEAREKDRCLEVDPQRPRPRRYAIESDWSAAGYWYSLLALSKKGELFLPRLRAYSDQGDRALADLFRPLGVESEFSAEGVTLRPGGTVAAAFTADFTAIPDQAQTFAVCCAGLGIPARLTGLRSLRVKETDRLAALVTELQKFGCGAEATHDEILQLPGGPLRVDGQTVETYDDHRMAMSFAPLAALGPLSLESPEVVEKSYPGFWRDWGKIADAEGRG